MRERIGGGMKKFSFNLDSLHRYRESLEDISMREFSAGLKAYMDKEAALISLREERRRLSEEIDKLRESGDKRLELALYVTYIKDLKELVTEMEEELKTLKRELEERRMDLIRVMKDRKVLDAMKEKSLEKYRADSTRTEQKVMDDIAGTMFSFGGNKNEK